MVARYPFSEVYKIRGFECNSFGFLRPSLIQKYVQETTVAHLETMGLHHHTLIEEGVLFVMTAVATKIYRHPKFLDTLHIYTCPGTTVGSRLFRETVLCDPSGTVLVECQTSWVVVDPATHRPLRPSAFQHTLPQLADYAPFCDPSRHIFAQCDTPSHTRTVALSDLDRNFHLNNTVYVDILLDSFGEALLGKEIDSFYIKYRGEAVLGDPIAISVAHAGNTFHAMGTVRANPCFDGQIIIK